MKLERARDLQQQRLAEQVSPSRTRIYKKPSVSNYGQVVDGPVSALDLVRLEGMSKDPAMSSVSMGNMDVVKRDPESVDYISDVLELRVPQQQEKVRTRRYARTRKSSERFGHSLRRVTSSLANALFFVVSDFGL